MMDKNACQNNENLAAIIKGDADLCVRCGLCLPHCPTYQITQNESESPRGRIQISAAFAEKKIPYTKTMHAHLNHCLACGNCESMCPAKVPYHELLVSTRELIQAQHPQALPFYIDLITRKPRLAKYIKVLINLYATLKLNRLFKKFKLLQLLPHSRQPYSWNTYYAPGRNKQGDVGLFLGCVNSLVDADTIQAAISLLTELGFAVHIPKKQSCCGAIHLHHGDRKIANQLSEQNQQIFAESLTHKIITLASGCGATLKELARTNDTFNVSDIHSFLAKVDWPADFNNATINKRILIHIPCTLKNALKQAESIEELLKRFGCNDLVISKTTSCCGAAGLHMLQYPEQSDALSHFLYQEILTVKPDIIVTANIGCLLQIKAFLAKKDQKIPITHPITLIFKAKNKKNLE